MIPYNTAQDLNMFLLLPAHRMVISIMAPTLPLVVVMDMAIGSWMGRSDTADV